MAARARGVTRAMMEKRMVEVERVGRLVGWLVGWVDRVGWEDAAGVEE